MTGVAAHAVEPTYWAVEEELQIGVQFGQGSASKKKVGAGVCGLYLTRGTLGQRERPYARSQYCPTTKVRLTQQHSCKTSEKITAAYYGTL